MRDLSELMQDSFTGSGASVALLAEFDFPTTLYMWSGYGNVEWNGNAYIGGGNLIGISPYQETQDLQAQGLKFELNGISSTLISAALQEAYQGRKCRLYIAIMQNVDTGIITEDGSYITTESGDIITVESQVLSAYKFFTGLMDTMDITDDGKTSRIVLTAENILILLKRTKTGRYTSEFQKSLYSDDKGLDFISQLQDKEIVW